MNLQSLCLIFACFFIAITNFPISSAIDEVNSPLIPVPPPLKLGWKTYFIQTFTMTNWFRAFQFCRYQGMQLASIENQEQEIALTQHLNNTGLYNTIFWISGQNLAQNDTWVWFSNGNTIIYENWDQDEPNNLGGREQCIQLRISSRVSGYRWNDADCSTEEYFICETNKFNNDRK